MGFCMKCGNQLNDGARFCDKCGTPVDGPRTRSNERQRYNGVVYKCPNCGETLDSFMIRCPTCNYELRGVDSTDSLRELQNKLSSTNSISEKESIIRYFPIPNSKEDILEFLIIASSNVDEIIDDRIAAAWKSKIEQVLQKIHILLPNDPAVASLEKQCKDIIKKYEKKLKRKIRANRSSTKSGFIKSLFEELFLNLPQTLIVFICFIIFFINLPLCRIDLDNVGTNGAQLGLIFLMLAFGFFSPKILCCQSPIPKIAALFGSILIGSVMIPLLKENVDNVGTNAFHLMLIIIVVVAISSLIRCAKKIKRENIKSDPLSLESFIIVLCFVAFCFVTYSIKTQSLGLPLIPTTTTYLKNYHYETTIADPKKERKSSIIPSVSLDSETDVDEGIYVFEIKNYKGMNLGSIGSLSSNYHVDKYGHSSLRIVAYTENGMIIPVKDMDLKKKYIVVGQNIEPSSKLIVVNDRNSDGEPYSNLDNYQSYDEIILYVTEVGKDEFEPKINEISPTLDRHLYYVRDYVGRNAASIGKKYNNKIFDEYGSADLRIIFTSEDGEYVDSEDINELKKYIVVNQSIEPNSELKIVYETDSSGKEYDNLVDTQSYDEINLIVKKLDKSIIKKMPKIKEEK